MLNSQTWQSKYKNPQPVNTSFPNALPPHLTFTSLGSSAHLYLQGIRLNFFLRFHILIFHSKINIQIANSNPEVFFKYCSQIVYLESTGHKEALKKKKIKPFKACQTPLRYSRYKPGNYEVMGEPSASHNLPWDPAWRRG